MDKDRDEAAKPAPGKAAPYPPADRTDAVEPRSFDPSADAPTPPGKPGDDPAEGKR